MKYSNNSSNIVHGTIFGAVLICHPLLEMPLQSRKQKQQKQQKQQQKQDGGRKTTRKAKGTPWTRFVKKIYDEMKRKDKNVKLGAAMKEASKRKSEMKE